MYNILTIVMQELNLNLKGALEWTTAYLKVIEERFMEGMEHLPTFSPEVNHQLWEYILALVMWPQSNDCWNFESGRYFGNKGLEIQKMWCVLLMPKKMKDPTMKTKDVEVTLVEL